MLLDSKTIHEKIWVADGARELMFVRRVMGTERSIERTEVTEVKETAQPDSLFTVPSDFTKMEVKTH